MQIRYRMVPYGTSFHACDGVRPENEDRAGALYRNEIAADVGGVFWPAGDHAPLPVMDHHFARQDQFPSASAAVLHAARKVAAWWDQVADCEEAWLVTHVNPDFDAYASLYLIRSLQLWRDFDPPAFGMAADAWRPVTKDEHPPTGGARIDWFAAPPSVIDPELRWRIMIAVIASHSDACRRTPCPKTQTAPAILYAAMTRGRSVQKDGASLIFDHIRAAVTGSHANPLTDPIFEGCAEFAPEVALLAREKDAYERDLRRARRAIVTIPSYKGEFRKFFDEKQSQPLLTPHLQPTDAQLAVDGSPSAVDGIFLRDPECILFKDLARMDTENSSLGRGFLFTAVAYSAGRPQATTNQTDYYFALDPERAGNLTLYPLWCRLEAAEIRALNRPELAGVTAELRRKEPRREYRHLAGEHQGLFSDPWFAGDNFRTTLIATPFRGTEIDVSGRIPDLTDDSVARIVRGELEYKIYRDDARVVDYGGGEAQIETRISMDTSMGALRDSRFRFCTVELVEGLQLAQGLQSKQIGEQLWSLLQPVNLGLALDFAERHLTQDRELIAVWSRHGLAIAYSPDARGRIEAARLQFGNVVTLLDKLLRAVKAKDETDTQSLRNAEELLRDVAVLRQQLSIPGGLLAFRRFVEAIGFHQTISTARDLLASQAERMAFEKSNDIANETMNLANATNKSALATSSSIAAVEEGNRKIELLEILFVTLYSIELLHILLGALAEGPDGAIETRVLTGFGAVFAGLAWWGFSRRSKGEVVDVESVAKRRDPWNPLNLVPLVTLLVLGISFLLTWEPMASECRRLLKHEAANAHAKQDAMDPLESKPQNNPSIVRESPSHSIGADQAAGKSKKN